MTLKKVAVIRHVPFEDLGTLDSVLAERHCEVTCFDSGYDHLDPNTMAEADLVIILGGPIGVYQVDEYPSLSDEIDIARSRLKNGKPLLGICLGSQIMAAALGARVYPGNAGKEIGWKPLSLAATPQPNPLADFAGSPVLHWHGDTFDLPDGAVLLASTDLYENQAFSYGNHALALQFHIETDARGLERWFIGHSVEIGGVSGLDVPSIRAQTAAHAQALGQNAKRFFTRWLQAIE